MEAVLTVARGECIEVEDLPVSVGGRYTEVFEPALAERQSLRAWATRYVRLVLHQSGYNKREACRLLDISYHTLQTYLHGIAVPVEAAGEPREIGRGAGTPVDTSADGTREAAGDEAEERGLLTGAAAAL